MADNIASYEDLNLILEDSEQEWQEKRWRFRNAYWVNIILLLA